MLAPIMEMAFAANTPNVNGTAEMTVIQSLRGLETATIHLLWILAVLISPLALH
jgi:hypothetical protein